MKRWLIVLLSIALLPLSTPAQATPSIAQYCAATNGGTGTNISCTLSSGVTAADIIFAGNLGEQSASTCSSTFFGSGYIAGITATNTGVYYICSMGFAFGAPGANATMINYDLSATGFQNIVALDITGWLATGQSFAIDGTPQTATGSGSSPTTCTTGSITPAQANDLVLMWGIVFDGTGAMLSTSPSYTVSSEAEATSGPYTVAGMAYDTGTAAITASFVFTGGGAQYYGCGFLLLKSVSSAGGSAPVYGISNQAMR